MSKVKRLTDECYEALKRMLTRCEIEPGERFTEKFLIERTGFGRTPVREALARLVYDGLVETLPRSGYRTTHVDAKTVAELFDIWRLIGPLVARRASERLTSPVLEDLNPLIKRLAGEGVPLEERMDVADEIFRALARATGSQDLVFLVERLRGKMRRLHTLFVNTPRGQEWWESQSRKWADTSWLSDPEVAAATVSLAIVTSQQGIMRTIEEAREVNNS